MRVEYGSVEKDGSPDLDADWLADGWLALFRKWIDDAERFGLAEPNALVLATVADGRPVSRSVLCKSVDETGITFFTNYDSAKGDELAATPYASATFPWYQLGRQVHIRGPVTKVDPQATEDYWSKRPRGSQLGAWASHQSQPIASRAALLDQLAEVTARFADSSASRCRRAGADTSSRPRWWSSGRAGKTGCTTGFGSSAVASSACSPDYLPGHCAQIPRGITRRSPDESRQHQQTRPRAGAPSR